MYPTNSFWSTVESSLVERYVKVHITQNSQCFTIRGNYHSTRLMKTRFLCTGVVSSKLAQPLTAYQLLTLMSVNFLTSFFGDW